MADYSFTDGVAATTPSGGVTVDWTYLREEVAFYLGWSRTVANWSADQLTKLQSILDTGLNQFYYPPPITSKDAKGNDVSTPVRWNFMHPTVTKTLTTDWEYDLPSDFGGNLKDVTFGAGLATTATPLTFITEKELRALKANLNTAGIPEYYSIRPKTSDGTAQQEWSLLIHPIPTAGTTILYSYDVSPQPLSESNPYPYGAAAHGRTILGSCLAIAEERFNDTQSVQRTAFQTLLAASYQYDMSFFPKEGAETWPAGDAGATTLDVTYDLLLKRIGHEFGLRWNYNLWNTTDRRKVEMVMHQGLRMFLAPPPLPPSRTSWIWSFLSPKFTITTLSPYATGTIEIVNGVVTVTGGTFPVWSAYAGSSLVVAGTSYTPSTKNLNGTLTLTSLTVNVDSGTSYSLVPPNSYAMPADFSSLEGPMTYAADGNYPWPPLKVYSEFQVRSELSRTSRVGRPIMMAEPMIVDALETGIQTFVTCFYPIPDDAYVLTGRYRLRLAALTVGTQSITARLYPPGGQEHGETILEACLAAVEKFNGKPGTHTAEFQRLLGASIATDQKYSSPESLGYDWEGSDIPFSNSAYPELLASHIMGSGPVTYNGQVY